MKMKEFGPPGGGARPWRPPLDPPMLCYRDISFITPTEAASYIIANE